MTAHPIAVGEFGLLSTVAKPQQSNFIGEQLAELRSKLRVQSKKSIRALLDAVASVLRFVPKLQVQRVHAVAAVSTGAFVAYKRPLWDQPIEKDIADLVGGDDLRSYRASDPAVHLAVAVPQVCRPDPIVLRSEVRLWQKSVEDRFRKLIVGEVIGVEISHESKRCQVVEGDHGSVVFEQVVAEGWGVAPLPSLSRGEGKDLLVPSGKHPSAHDTTGHIGTTLDVPNLELEAKLAGTYLSHVSSIARHALQGLAGIFIRARCRLAVTLNRHRRAGCWVSIHWGASAPTYAGAPLKG